MPFEDPDPADPMTLHGVVVETGSDEAVTEMAVCFIEEYARMQFDAERILRLFQTVGYAGPAMALQALGEQRIRALINDEMALRRPQVCGKERHSLVSEGISLPVLQTGCH